MPMQTIIMTVVAGLILMVYLGRRRSRLNKED